MEDYKGFLERKLIIHKPSWLEVSLEDLNPMLFDWQKVIVRWALFKGKAALFEDTGLGKTIQQLSWADAVCKHTSGDVLVFAPLAVSYQTVREGAKYDIKVTRVADQSEVVPGINITNYERLEKFDPESFIGIVLDESGIIKDSTAQFRNKVIYRFVKTPYKLCCSATPSPNDYTELGNTSEFLGVMTMPEMKSMFFVNDSGDTTASWRLKGHVQDNKFWEWLATWCVMIQLPSNIGFDDSGYILPKLNFIEHILPYEGPRDTLFVEPAAGLSEVRKSMRQTLQQRCEHIANIVNDSDDIWAVWCNLNDEGDELSKIIKDSIQVAGKTDDDLKVQYLKDFGENEIKCLVTKPKIAMYGLNYQNCHNIVITGLSHSFEQFYQLIRRFWRYGQDHEVNVHIVIGEREGGVLETVKRKDAQMKEMFAAMAQHMGELTTSELLRTSRKNTNYCHAINMTLPFWLHVEKHREIPKNSPKVIAQEITDQWALYHGDSAELLQGIPTDSIHFIIYSPPFQSLFVYSDSERDLGNCNSDEQYYEQFRFIAKELYRILMPGRIMAVHCMTVPAMKERDGYIGLKDFRGDLIRLFQSLKFIWHSEHIIPKDPLIEATRTKALGLMHKQLMKDSAMCRAGLPDFLEAFRKPGDNPEKCSRPMGLQEYFGENEPTTGVLSHERFRRWASPVWGDIRQTNTLNYKAARDANDERHICPISLDVPARAIQFWSNTGDIVLSPFAGIGSEGYQSVKLGRKSIGIELKESYFKQAVKNMKSINDNKQLELPL